MGLPRRIRDIIVNTPDPGEIYARCIGEISEGNVKADYALTETIAYAAEFNYALNFLAGNHRGPWKNFADPSGSAGEKLWRILDPAERRRIAFVGSGPYPVTAFLLKERYPSAEITCVDNHVAAYLMSRAVIGKAGLDIETVFDDAAEIDYRPFDVVIVAAMVSGKSRLVEKILSESSALILVRGKVSAPDGRVFELESSFSDDGVFTG